MVVGGLGFDYPFTGRLNRTQCSHRLAPLRCFIGAVLSGANPRSAEMGPVTSYTLGYNEYLIMFVCKVYVIFMTVGIVSLFGCFCLSLNGTKTIKNQSKKLFFRYFENFFDVNGPVKVQDDLLLQQQLFFTDKMTQIIQKHNDIISFLCKNQTRYVIGCFVTWSLYVTVFSLQIFNCGSLHWSSSPARSNYKISKRISKIFKTEG